MLNRLLLLSSVVNVLAGAVLVFTWAADWATDPARHVPLIVLAIGGSMILQGLYSAGYSLGWLARWGDLASGVLLGGQLISGTIGLAMLVNGVIANSQNTDQEMAPVFAGLMIGVNALLALLYLITSGKTSPQRTTPPTRARGPA